MRDSTYRPSEAIAHLEADQLAVCLITRAHGCRADPSAPPLGMTTVPGLLESVRALEALRRNDLAVLLAILEEGPCYPILLLFAETGVDATRSTRQIPSTLFELLANHTLLIAPAADAAPLPGLPRSPCTMPPGALLVNAALFADDASLLQAFAQKQVAPGDGADTSVGTVLANWPSVPSVSALNDAWDGWPFAVRIVGPCPSAFGMTLAATGRAAAARQDDSAELMEKEGATEAVAVLEIVPMRLIAALCAARDGRVVLRASSASALAAALCLGDRVGELTRPALEYFRMMCLRTCEAVDTGAVGPLRRLLTTLNAEIGLGSLTTPLAPLFRRTLPWRACCVGTWRCLAATAPPVRPTVSDVSEEGDPDGVVPTLNSSTSAHACCPQGTHMDGVRQTMPAAAPLPPTRPPSADASLAAHVTNLAETYVVSVYGIVSWPCFLSGCSRIAVPSSGIPTTVVLAPSPFLHAHSQKERCADKDRWGVLHRWAVDMASALLQLGPLCARHFDGLLALAGACAFALGYPTRSCILCRTPLTFAGSLLWTCALAAPPCSTPLCRPSPPQILPTVGHR